MVATLTVKEGLFLSELDGDADPDDVGEFTQRERFRVLSKFASKGLLENDEKFEVSTKGLGTVTLSIPTPALGKTKSSVGLCLYYLAVRYLWVPLAVVCGIIAVFDLNDRYYGDYVPSAFDMIIIIGIALVLHELSHIAAAHYYWIPTNAVGIGLYAPQCTTKNRPRPVPWVESDLTVKKTVRSQGGGVMPRGQPPAEYGCRSKAAAPTKTTAQWMVCCAALAGAGCQRRCKPHIRSGTRRQTASGCKCFPKR